MYSAFQSNNDDQTTETFTIKASGMQEVVDIAALNSRVKFDRTDIPFEQREILGDATETGLTRFAGRQLRTDYDAHTRNNPKVFEGQSNSIATSTRLNYCPTVPFNSTNKWALVIVCVAFCC